MKDIDFEELADIINKVDCFGATAIIEAIQIGFNLSLEDAANVLVTLSDLKMIDIDKLKQNDCLRTTFDA